MMAKNKEKDWCPLSGPIPYRRNEDPRADSLINIIDRARMFWHDDNAHATDGAGNMLASYSAKDAPKAQRLYEVWDKLREEERVFDKVLSLATAGSMTTNATMREHYLEDVRLSFWKAGQDHGEEYKLIEIITIIIIREAMEALKALKKDGVMNMLPGQLSLYLEHISPDAIRGKKVIKGSRKGSEKAGERRRAQVADERGDAWADWQRRAEEIWERRPGLSKIAKAKLILKDLKKETPFEEQYDLSKPSTIRKRIKKVRA